MKNKGYELPSFAELISEQFFTQPPEKPRQTGKAMNVIKADDEVRLLKVAAYCRVSTDKEDQQSSIAIQKEHFQSVADKHEDWLFAGVYADIVSGTRKEKRPELQRLLFDCAAGRVNLVLTKSVSRFARNTADLLEMVRNLTQNGCDILFERENLDTRTMSSEFLLTILASLAEDESHSISDNCRWGLQRRFEDGTYRAASAPYGYDLVDGNYAVNEAEAEIVREIFRRAIAGETQRAIADDLNARNVPTKRAGQTWKGKTVHPEWTGHSIGAILKNVSYTGDQIFQKHYTDRDFHMRTNKGQHPQYLHEDHHPAIISKTMFRKMQKIVDANRPKGEPAPKQSTTLSGMLACGCCGANLTRQKNSVGTVHWICRTHRKKASACALPSIRENDFIHDFDSMLQDLKENDEIVRKYRDGIVEKQKAHPKVSAIEKRISTIEKEHASLINNLGRVRGADFRARQNAYRREKETLLRQLDEFHDNRIDLTEELLSRIHSEGSSFVSAFSQTVESVMVHERGLYTVMFKCGLALEYDGR